MYMEKNNRAPRARGEKNVWISGVIGGGAGLAVTLVSALLLPLALVSLDDPKPFVFPLACLCVFVGGILGGFVSAKNARGNELLASLIGSAAMLLPMLVISLFINRQGSALHLLLVAASAVISFLLGSGVIRAISQNKKRNMKRAMKRR